MFRVFYENVLNRLQRRFVDGSFDFNVTRRNFGPAISRVFHGIKQGFAARDQES